MANLSRPSVQTALNAARCGVRVFPVDRATVVPLVAGGVGAASTDLETVWRWWQTWPDANTGVATGAHRDGAGYDVVWVQAGLGDGLAGMAHDRGLLDGWSFVTTTGDGDRAWWFPADPAGQSSFRLADAGIRLHAADSWTLAPTAIQAGRDGTTRPIIMTDQQPAAVTRPVDGAGLASFVLAARQLDGSDPAAAGTIRINQAAWEYWRGQAERAAWLEPYLTSRALPGLPVGLAADSRPDDLHHYLAGHGWTSQQMHAAGLVRQGPDGRWLDRFRDRIIVPYRDSADQIIGFMGRANPNRKTTGPKYLNTPQTAVFHKAAAFLGWDTQTAGLLASNNAIPVLVEGSFDVEAIRRACQIVMPNSPPRLVPLAAGGTGFTASHLDLLRATIPGELRVVVATDADQAGRKALARIYELLTPAERSIAQAVTMPEGSDPADMLVSAGPHRLHQAVALAEPLMVTLLRPLCAQANAEPFLEGQLAAWRDIEALALTAGSTNRVIPNLIDGRYELREFLRDQLAASPLHPQTQADILRDVTHEQIFPTSAAARQTITTNATNAAGLDWPVETQLQDPLGQIPTPTSTVPPDTGQPAPPAL